MTQKLKNDIKTIIEVIAYSVIYFCISMGFATYNWLWYPFFFLCLGGSIYNSYFLRYKSNFLLFPTLNDESSKMTAISFGVMILIFSSLGYFVFGMNPYYCIIGIAVGIVVILFGFFESPKGWISIEKNLLTLYGVQNSLDIRQLTEITLKNDKISLTNIYGETINSYNLKLNPLIAQNIKGFIEKRLQKNEVLIIDNVTIPIESR